MTAPLYIPHKSTLYCYMYMHYMPCLPRYMRCIQHTCIVHNHHLHWIQYQFTHTCTLTWGCEWWGGTCRCKLVAGKARCTSTSTVHCSDLKGKVGGKGKILPIKHLHSNIAVHCEILVGSTHCRDNSVVTEMCCLLPLEGEITGVKDNTNWSLRLVYWVDKGEKTVYCNNQMIIFSKLSYNHQTWVSFYQTTCKS